MCSFAQIRFTCIETEIDCTSTNDISIVLRVFEYGLRDALKHREVGKDKIILKFPTPKIILLEHNSNSPAEVTLELDFGGGNTIDFKVPTMKFLDYSIEDLKKQHMVILLPLYLLKLRQQIDKAMKQDDNEDAVRKNAQALKDLINNGILKTIEDSEKAERIDSYDSYVLAGLVKKLYNHLYGSIKEFEDEGVRTMLDDMLLVEYEDKLLIKREEDMLKVAMKLLAKGMSAEDIVDTTELPIAKVKGLQLQKVSV